jgi:hypothetical protein
MVNHAGLKTRAPSRGAPSSPVTLHLPHTKALSPYSEFGVAKIDLEAILYSITPKLWSGYQNFRPKSSPDVGTSSDFVVVYVCDGPGFSFDN